MERRKADVDVCSIRVSKGGRIPERLDSELQELAAAAPEPSGTPLRAVATLAQALGDFEPEAADPLGRRRHRTAARRVATGAVDAAVCVRGAFGDRPEADAARPRALADLEPRCREPGVGCAKALGEVARLALALPPIPDGEDWQLGAIAFVDERALRELYDACLALAAVAVREAAAA